MRTVICISLDVNTLLMDVKADFTIPAPNDTAYNRWSCHSGFKLLCKLCRTSPPPQWGPDLPFFWACRPCGPAGWLALLLTKAGDVETNPGPTTLNKKVWICDICHKQIHVRKQISIRCNRIEHWVHLRCAGIRQAQYTDTWTCHLHRESRLTPHTDPTPALPSPSHSHTLTPHTHATQTTVHASQSPQQPHAQHRVLRQPHKQTKDYHRTANTTQTHRPSSKSERNLIILQVNINGTQKQTRGAQTAYSRHTCRHHHNSGNQAHP